MLGFQTTIRLRLEDYEKLERMSKASGYRSIGDYIQKLVEMDLKRCKK